MKLYERCATIDKLAIGCSKDHYAQLPLPIEYLASKRITLVRHDRRVGKVSKERRVSDIDCAIIMTKDNIHVPVHQLIATYVVISCIQQR